MASNLRLRKRQAVQEAIYEAAIQLFSEEGFDETTVEQIAESAGVSRRSFFRYFASKDDLLAQNVVNYGAVLAQAVEKCPSDVPILGVLKETVNSGVRHVAVAHSRTREIIEIAIRSASARQAHQSRMMDVEDALTKAFAERFKDAARGEVNPRLLAGITLAIMNSTISSWFEGEHKDLQTSSKNVFGKLMRTFCETGGKVSPQKQSAARRNAK